jgi:hypothetical protein
MKILFLIILASIIYLAINYYQFQVKVKVKESFTTCTPYFIDYYNQYGATNFAYYDGYMVPV